MNILIVARGIPTDNNPMHGIFEFDQAKALTLCGHKVTYFSIDLRSLHHKRKFGIQKYTREGIEVHVNSLPVGAVPLPLKMCIGKAALMCLYKSVFNSREKPDIIHAHFTEYGFLAAALSEKEKIPLVITEHSSIMGKEEVPNGLLSRANRAYHAASKVIAVSNALSENIKKLTGVEPITVHNIVDADVFAATKPISHTKYRFVSVGNLIPSKGMELLIDAFAAFHNCHQDSELDIIGSGSELDVLVNQVKDLGVQACVSFSGRLTRQEIAHHFQTADCFVLASKLETFGLVYAEAMMAGLPVIATKCGGPEDFVVDTVGVLADRSSSESICNAMLTIFSRRTDYHTEIIRRYALDHFSPEMIAEKLTKVYREVLYLENNV